jgi:hypothetical protein
MLNRKSVDTEWLEDQMEQVRDQVADAIDSYLKHGKHNQKSHGRRGLGASGAAITSGSTAGRDKTFTDDVDNRVQRGSIQKSFDGNMKWVRDRVKKHLTGERREKALKNLDDIERRYRQHSRETDDLIRSNQNDVKAYRKDSFASYSPEKGRTNPSPARDKMMDRIAARNEIVKNRLEESKRFVREVMRSDYAEEFD